MITHDIPVDWSFPLETDPVNSLEQIARARQMPWLVFLEDNYTERKHEQFNVSAGMRDWRITYTLPAEQAMVYKMTYG
jgi:predicted DNA-binding ribbon-helix-helix protein